MTQFGMDLANFAVRVPEGGSSCAKCEYLGADKLTCKNKGYVEWNKGSNLLRAPANKFCCNNFEPSPEMKKQMAREGLAK